MSTGASDLPARHSCQCDKGSGRRVGIDVYKEWLGIAEGPRPPDHYELLRLVQFDDDTERIRKNYRKLNAHVRRYASGQYSIESQDLLNELAKAMLCLVDLDRKKEYDEGLGRVFPEGTDDFGRRPIENILIDQEHLTKDQAKQAEQFAESCGLTMRDALVQMEFVDTETAAMALATSINRSFVDLAEVVPDDNILDKLSRAFVKRNSCIPLFTDEGVLLVACIIDLDPNVEEELRLRYGVPARAVIATPLDVNQAITKYYAPGMRDEAMLDEEAQERIDGNGKKPKKKKKSKDQQKAAKKAKAERPTMESMTPDEVQFRKQFGILLMLWGAIGPILLDHFYLIPRFWPNSPLPFVSAFAIAPATIWYVLKVFWR